MYLGIFFFKFILIMFGSDPEICKFILTQNLGIFDHCFLLSFLFCFTIFIVSFGISTESVRLKIVPLMVQILLIKTFFPSLLTVDGFYLSVLFFTESLLCHIHFIIKEFKKLSDTVIFNDKISVWFFLYHLILCWNLFFFHFFGTYFLLNSFI